MATFNALLNSVKTSLSSDNKIKVKPDSADTSYFASNEVGVLIEGSSATHGISGFVTIKGGDSNITSIPGGFVSISAGHQLDAQSIEDGGHLLFNSGGGGKSGNITLATLENSSTNASNSNGSITIETSMSQYALNLIPGQSVQNTGSISLKSGSVFADDKSSGEIVIQTGDPHDHSGSSSGDITISTGGNLTTDLAGLTGNLLLTTGKGGLNGSGEIGISTGATKDSLSGSIVLTSGAVSGAFDSGSITISSGTSTSRSGTVNIGSSDVSDAASFSTGALFLETGSATALSPAGTGLWVLGSGNSQSGTTGSGNLRTGNSNAQTGALSIYTGNSAFNLSGSVSVKSGTGSTGTGTITLESGEVVGLGSSGDVSLTTGNTNNASSGNVLISTGDTGSDAVSPGYVLITTGQPLGLSNGAEIRIFSALQNNNLTTGEVSVYSGSNASGHSGSVSVSSGISGKTTGDVSLNTGSSIAEGSGSVSVFSGNGAQVTGDVTLNTGDSSSDQTGSVSVSSGEGDLKTGDISLTTGISRIEDSGAVNISSGGSELASGDISLTTGDSNTTQSGDVTISTGSSVLNSGDIILSTGDSSTANKGEIKLSSNSLTTTNPLGQNLLTNLSEGVLKALGLQVLGYGKMEVEMNASTIITRIPLVFLSGFPLIFNDATNDYDLNPSALNYSKVTDTYTGISPLDQTTNGYSADITKENLMVHFFISNLNEDLTINEGLRLDLRLRSFPSWTSDVFIDARGNIENTSGNTETVYINYVVLHHDI